MTLLVASLLFHGWAGGLCWCLLANRFAAHYGLFCALCGPCGWLGYFVLKPDSFTHENLR